MRRTWQKFNFHKEELIKMINCSGVTTQDITKFTKDIEIEVFADKK